MTKIWCATTNSGKVREFLRLGADVEILPGMDRIAVPDENGDTFEQNAAEKAVYYSRHAPGLLFADDSGLEVDALNGEPGRARRMRVTTCCCCNGWNRSPIGARGLCA